MNAPRDIDHPGIAAARTAAEEAAKAEAQDARNHLVIVAGAVAMHGLLSAVDDYSPSRILDHDSMAKEAFDIGEAFIAEAERRFGKLNFGK